MVTSEEPLRGRFMLLPLSPSPPLVHQQSAVRQSFLFSEVTRKVRSEGAGQWGFCFWHIVEVAGTSHVAVSADIYLAIHHSLRLPLPGNFYVRHDKSHTLDHQLLSRIMSHVTYEYVCVVGILVSRSVAIALGARKASFSTGTCDQLFMSWFDGNMAFCKAGQKSNYDIIWKLQANVHKLPVLRSQFPGNTNRSVSSSLFAHLLQVAGKLQVPLSSTSREAIKLLHKSCNRISPTKVVRIFSFSVKTEWTIRTCIVFPAFSYNCEAVSTIGGESKICTGNGQRHSSTGGNTEKQLRWLKSESNLHWTD